MSDAYDYLLRGINRPTPDAVNTRYLRDLITRQQTARRRTSPLQQALNDVRREALDGLHHPTDEANIAAAAIEPVRDLLPMPAGKRMAPDDAPISAVGLTYGMVDCRRPRVSPKSALEMRTGLSAVLGNYASQILALSHWGESRTADVRNIEGLAYLVERSEVVIWQREQWEVASGGLDTFVGTRPTLEQCRAHNQLWFWDDGGITFEPGPQDPFELDVTCGLQCLLVIPCVPTASGVGQDVSLDDVTAFMGVAVFSPVIHADDPRISDTLPRLRFLPPVNIYEDITAYNAVVLAARRFMSLDFVSLEPTQEPMSRQVRRNMERKGVPVPEVMTIILRRLARKHSKAKGEGRKVNWKCQWTVGYPWGIWHNHWHPSEGVNRPVWHRPHLKGDPTMPLKPPRERVYKVSR